MPYADAEQPCQLVQTQLIRQMIANIGLQPLDLPGRQSAATSFARTQSAVVSGDLQRDRYAHRLGEERTGESGLDCLAQHGPSQIGQTFGPDVHQKIELVE